MGEEGFVEGGGLDGGGGEEVAGGVGRAEGDGGEEEEVEDGGAREDLPQPPHGPRASNPSHWLILRITWASLG